MQKWNIHDLGDVINNHTKSGFNKNVFNTNVTVKYSHGQIIMNTDSSKSSTIRQSLTVTTFMATETKTQHYTHMADSTVIIK